MLQSSMGLGICYIAAMKPKEWHYAFASGSQSFGFAREVSEVSIRDFPNIRVPYFGVLIIRILLFSSSSSLLLPVGICTRVRLEKLQPRRKL